VFVQEKIFIVVVYSVFTVIIILCFSFPFLPRVYDKKIILDCFTKLLELVSLNKNKSNLSHVKHTPTSKKRERERINGEEK
jgi:hypothetical protein